jgi:fructosamine-3-kinase
MYQCEYESLLAINKAITRYSPRPVGWGHYQSNPDAWFLLTSFINMHDNDPDPEFLPSVLSQLHQKALALDGRCGFHVTVISGGLPVNLAQSESWEDFFFRYMRYMIRAEQIAAGPRTPEMERLLEDLFNRIIPRLLRPLETGGREIVPVLLHTNLWAGNAGIDSEGLPIIFDPCSMYGHNECGWVAIIC